MHFSTSFSSLSSPTSNNSSAYGSQTILDLKDLSSLESRCRSSVISSFDSNQNLFSSTNCYSQFPSTRRTTDKCRPLFLSSLSSTSSSLCSLIQKKLSENLFRKQYFAKLCHNHRLLLALYDYQCTCGCQFSMKYGTFVILYEDKLELSSSWNRTGLITVISNQLICSRIPSHFVCDINVLRERVRSRTFCSNEQSFDL